MSRIDWQAYDDGSMSSEQRAAADSLLEQSEAARKELESIKSFRAAILDAGREVHIPTARLERQLSQTANRSVRRWFMPTLVGAPALALAVFVWAFFAFDFRHYFDPLKLDYSPTRATFATNDPVRAAEWAESKVSFAVPVVNLGQNAPMFMTRHGDDWVCYDYVVNGEKYYLYLCPQPHPTGDRPTVRLPNGRTVIKGQGLRWRQGNLCYYLRGPEDDVEIQLASQVSSAVEGWDSKSEDVL